MRSVMTDSKSWLRYELTAPNLVFLAHTEKINPSLTKGLYNSLFKEQFSSLTKLSFDEVTPRDTYALLADKKPPTALDVDPKGIVTYGFASGLVEQRSPRSGRKRFELLAHDGIVTGVSYRNSLYVTAGTDSMVKVWDQRGHEKPLASLLSRKGAVRRLIPVKTQIQLTYLGYTQHEAVKVIVPYTKDKIMLDYPKATPQEVETLYRKQLAAWQEQLPATKPRARTWPTLDKSILLHQKRFCPQFQPLLRTFGIPTSDEKFPTALLPVDESECLVGFSDGALEHWDIHIGRKFTYKTGTTGFVVDLVPLVPLTTTVLSFAAAFHKNQIQTFSIRVTTPIKTLVLPSPPITFHDLDVISQVHHLLTTNEIMTFDARSMKRLQFTFSLDEAEQTIEDRQNRPSDIKEILKQRQEDWKAYLKNRDNYQ